MSTKRRITLPSISGIAGSSAAGTVGYFNLPLSYRYHQIQLAYQDGGSTVQNIATGLAAVNGSPSGTGLIADLIVMKNGIAERTHSALQLDHLNGLNGSQYQIQSSNGSTGGANNRQIQTIFFAEPWRKDKSDTDGLAWNVNAANGFNTFQLQITLGSAMPSTGSLVAYAWVEDAVLPPPNGKPQAVKKVYRQSLPASGTSNDISTLDARDAYQVISLINPTGAAIGKVTLKLGGTPVLDSVLREDNVGALTNTGMNPANSTTAGAFGYDIVLDADDPINSALPAPVSPWLTLFYTNVNGAQTAATATGNVIALIERLGPLD
ncbi:MAG: hypothetical protein WCS94_08330 [Verrucomicrobiota bacterium]